MNTLTMRSARNTKRCITLPQTVPATWKWKKKIPLRGKRRGVLSTDFLSMLLFSLRKCKSPLWRKAKTDFFYKLRHPRGCLSLCLHIFWVPDFCFRQQKRRFRVFMHHIQWSRRSGRSGSFLFELTLQFHFLLLYYCTNKCLSSNFFKSSKLFFVLNLFAALTSSHTLQSGIPIASFVRRKRATKKDAFASSCTTYCSLAEAVGSKSSYVNYSWRCQELGEHGSVAIRQHKCTQTYPDTANAPAFP